MTEPQSQRKLASYAASRHWSMARGAVGLVLEDLDRAVHFAARGLLGWTCWAIGHRWGPWHRSPILFVPPERRCCPRCLAAEYRGKTPEFEVRVEGGTLWRHDNIQN